MTAGMLIVGRRQQPPERGPQAEQVERVAGDELGADLFSLVGGAGCTIERRAARRLRADDASLTGVRTCNYCGYL
jgi:hypothetical protein